MSAVLVPGAPTAAARAIVGTVLRAGPAVRAVGDDGAALDTSRVLHAGPLLTTRRASVAGDAGAAARAQRIDRGRHHPGDVIASIDPRAPRAPPAASSAPDARALLDRLPSSPPLRNRMP